MFLLVRHCEDEQFEVSLTDSVDERVGAIADDLGGTLEVPIYLRPFFVTTRFELGQDVQAFLGEILAEEDEVEIIGWASHIWERERDMIEAWGQTAVDPDFRIIEATPQGEHVPALQQPKYFPLVHIVASGPSPLPHGLDLPPI